MVANTSFIADRSSLNRPITLVRRRSSTNERSARLVVSSRMRCRAGTRWIASNASRSSLKQPTAPGSCRPNVPISRSHHPGRRPGGRVSDDVDVRHHRRGGFLRQLGANFGQPVEPTGS